MKIKLFIVASVLVLLAGFNGERLVLTINNLKVSGDQIQLISRQLHADQRNQMQKA